jgi:uncharacterized protein YqhQ
MTEEDKLHSLGGQAVIEGIMMRGKDNYAIACRRKDGTITTTKKEISNLYNKFPFNLIFVRGIFALISAMKIGLDALVFSSNLSLEDEGEKQITKKGMATTMIITFTIAIALFVGVPYLLTTLMKYISTEIVENQLLFNLIDGLFRIIIILGYMFIISLSPDIKRVFEYHGAEHKTIALYEKGEELTIEGVKKESRFHPRCGTSFVIIVILVLVIVHSIIFTFLPDINRFYNILIRIALIPIVAGISYEIIKLAGKFRNSIITKILVGPGLLTQYITTREPDDYQIEVAIESVKCIVDD